MNTLMRSAFAVALLSGAALIAAPASAMAAPAGAAGGVGAGAGAGGFSAEA